MALKLPQGNTHSVSQLVLSVDMGDQGLMRLKDWVFLDSLASDTAGIRIS